MDHKFWAKVDQRTPEECWPWTGFKKPSGHGLTTYKSFVVHASRKAYILSNGPFDGRLSVLHTCDNAACCNPRHLYLGTQSDNMIDRFGKTEASDRKRRGRTTVLTTEQLEKLWLMRRDGVLLKDCAREFDVHIATICRYISALRREKSRHLREGSSSAHIRETV